MTRTQSRLAKLEAMISKPQGSSPSLFYMWCLQRNIEAPEPTAGEMTRDWLQRVPIQSLKQIVEAAG